MSEHDSNLPPIPAPLPVEALPYAQWRPHDPYYPSRPGILTGVSVISIVVACLSCIASLFSGCETGGLYIVSQMSQTMNAATTTTTTTATGFSMTTTATSTGTTNFSANNAGGVGVLPTPNNTSTTAPSTEPSAGETASAPPTPLPITALTPGDVANVVARVQAASQNRLNSAQLAALTTALQDPNQTLVAYQTAWSPVTSVQVNPDGSAFLRMSGGFATITPQGQLQENNFGMPKINVSGTICLLAVAEALASIGLAIFLFVAGIFVMRSSPAGRRLHLIYAWLKIPLVIASGIIFGSLGVQFFGSIPGASISTAGMFTAAIFYCVASLIYPVALLIAMNTRSVKAFYSA